MILVTGANGFVGKGLILALAAQGIAHRAATRSGEGGSIAIGNITASTDWSKALVGVDAVVHLAARVHVMNETDADPDTAFDQVNLHGTTNLARQAAEAGVRRLVYVSSIKVNGEKTSIGKPFRAEDVPAPADPYGRSKWRAELALRQLAGDTGLELTIIRPPLVYGEGVRGNFGALIRLVDRAIPLPLGAIDNRRSMVGLDNLHSLIITTLSHPAAAGRVFLVSDDRDISIRTLVELIGQALGRRPLLLPFPPSLLHGLAGVVGQGGAAQRLLSSLQVDITDTKGALGWKPASSVEKGVTEAVVAYRSRLST